MFDRPYACRPTQALSDAEHKALANTAARCALRGTALAVTDDDHGAPLFMVTEGAATHHFNSLGEVDQWLLAGSEVTS